MHNQWHEATAFKPERFMPGGEYDSFDESIRAYMFLPFIQVGGYCACVLCVAGSWRGRVCVGGGVPALHPGG